MVTGLGLFGKHPGYGDFLRHGFSDPVCDGLRRWADKRLHEVREEMGNRWGPFWDGAQELRFWIGGAVMGQPVCGILRPSQDKVGRRYPLIVGLEGASVPAPVSDPDQTLYEKLSQHLATASPGHGAEALLEGLDEELAGIATETRSEAELNPILWAHHPGDNLDALLSATAHEDARRALLTRSYWWAAPSAGRHPVWLGQPGLPDAGALAWLLAGVKPQATPQPEDATVPAPHLTGPVPSPTPTPASLPPAERPRPDRKEL